MDSADLVTAALLDSSLQSPKSGYNYTIDVSSDRLNYTVYAIASSSMGRYDYYTCPDYVIRFATDSTRAPSGLAGEPVR